MKIIKAVQFQKTEIAKKRGILKIEECCVATSRIYFALAILCLMTAVGVLISYVLFISQAKNEEKVGILTAIVSTAAVFTVVKILYTTQKYAFNQHLRHSFLANRIRLHLAENRNAQDGSLSEILGKRLCLNFDDGASEVKSPIDSLLSTIGRSKELANSNELVKD